MWHVTHDTGHMTRDKWHVTNDIWHMTCDLWWGMKILSKFLAPQLLWFGRASALKILNERITLWMNEWMILITKVFIEQTGSVEFPNVKFDQLFSTLPLVVFSSRHIVEVHPTWFLGEWKRGDILEGWNTFKQNWKLMFSYRPNTFIQILSKFYPSKFCI